MRNLLKYTMFLLLFLVGCVSLCFFPVVQKFLASRILSHYFEDVSIDSIRIGLRGANIKQFSVRHNDATFRFNEMKAAWSAKDLLLFRTLNIKNAAISDASISLESEMNDTLDYGKKIDGLALDKNSMGSYIDNVRSKINNVLSYFKGSLSIDSLDLNGTFDVYEKTLGEFSANLSNFAPLKDARLEFALTSSFSRKFEGSFSLKGGMSAHRAVNGSIDRVHLDSSVVSKNYSNSVKKKFELTLGYEEESGDLYFRFTDSDTAHEIVNLVSKKSSKSGNTTLSLNGYCDNNILENFLFGNKTDTWSVVLNGKGESVGNEQDWMFKSNLDVNLSNKILASIFPGLGEDLKVRVISSLIFKDKCTELASLTANIEDAKKHQLRCVCDLQAPYKISSVSGNSNGSVTKLLQGITVDIKIDRFDLELLNSILPEMIVWGVGRGLIEMQVKNDGIYFVSQGEKLHFSGLGLDYREEEVANGLNLDAKLSCKFKENIELGLLEISLMEGDTIPLQGDFKIMLGKNRNNISGYLVGDLPAILNQPLFNQTSKISAGVTSSKFDIDIYPHNILSGEIGAKLKSVSFAGEKKSLDMECDAKVSSISGFKGMKFDVSGNMHYFGDTDLDLRGTFVGNQDDGSKNIQIALSGDKMCVSDILVLKNLFDIKRFNKNGRNFISDTEVLKCTSNEHALFEESSIDLGVGIDEIFWENFRCLSKLSCSVRCGPDGVSIPNLKCYVFDAPFNASWHLTRNTAETRDRCAINTEFSLSHLNASKCVHAFGYPADAFTGQFDLDGSFEAEETSALKALSQLRGSIHLNGHSGNVKFTSFLSDSKKTVLGIAGIAGSIFGGKGAAMSELIDYFDDFKYDSVTASVVRGGDNNIVLDNFVVKNDDVKFISRGKISYRPDVNVGEYGLFVDSQIFTKEDLTDLFKKFGLISGEPDYYGYSSGPHVAIHGTVGKPDFSEIFMLFTKIGSAKQENESDEKTMHGLTDLVEIFGK